MKVNCPHCKTELEEDDIYDFDYDADSKNKIWFHAIGHCPKCEREYQYERVFKLSDEKIEGFCLI